MKFVDVATITVKAGKGGDGCVSMRRQRNRPKGGPDGGDGGDGGSIVIRADKQLTTLLDYRYNHLFRAKNGQPGQGNDRFGASADDVVIPVPVGTQVFEIDTNELLADLDHDGSSLLAAHGGRGGKGNLQFKSSTRQAPRKAEAGTPGEGKNVRMELKLVADVGVVGFPNTGKSTLVSRVSAAKPKIADYPFTTLVPTLGVVPVEEHKSFVIADIPGIIEGAHSGAGLGHQFLRHVERCRLLVHLVTWSAADEPDANLLVKNFDILENEMVLYTKDLANTPRLVALSMLDLPEVKSQLAKAKNLFLARNIELLAFSSVSGEGLDLLLAALKQKLTSLDKNS